MSASTSDKITDTRNAGRPNSARVSSLRSAGGTTLACDNLTGWPTASKVHFVTYQIDSNSNPVPGTQIDAYGIVSGNSIGSFTVVDGTDSGNSVGDIVEMLPTAAWAQDLADALTTLFNRDGTWKTGAALIQPTIASLVNAQHNHQNAAGGGTLGTAAMPNLSLAGQSLSNPYKFRVYRNAALTANAASASKLTFDAEDFDTNNNFATGTYTAPVAGFYVFGGRFTSTTTRSFASIYKNGAEEARGLDFVATSGEIGPVVSTLVQCAQGDTIELYYYTQGAVSIGTGRTQSYFYGHLISQT